MLVVLFLAVEKVRTESYRCSERCGGGQEGYTSSSRCACPPAQKTEPHRSSPSPEHGGWSKRGPETVEKSCVNSSDISKGVRMRPRTCKTPCECSITETKPTPCLMSSSHFDSNWGGWSSWSSWQENNPSCVTCSTGSKTEKSHRESTNPGVRSDSQEFRPKSCIATPCPIDGGWSDWSVWEEDSVFNVTGASGPRTEIGHRECSSRVPVQEHGARGACDLFERTSWACTKQPCSIDGGSSDWGACEGNVPLPVTSGDGTKPETGHTEYSNHQYQPPRQNYGTDWSETQNTNCAMDPCARSSEMNVPWRVTSSNEARTEMCHKHCTNQHPRYDGHVFGTDSSENQSVNCSLDPCPIHGGWSDRGIWEEDSVCDVTCDFGTTCEQRHSECTNPVSARDGYDCDDELFSQVPEIPCVKKPCPIHGHWSEWSSWTPCEAWVVKGDQASKPEIRQHACCSQVPSNDIDQHGEEVEGNFNCSANQCTGICEKESACFGNEEFIKRNIQCSKQLCGSYWEKEQTKCQFCCKFEIGVMTRLCDCCQVVYGEPGISHDMPYSSANPYHTCPPS